MTFAFDVLAGASENGLSRQADTVRQTKTITVYATLPCPIVVRFNAAFSFFIRENNAAGYTPIQCPTMRDSSPMTLESQILHAEREEDVPDILITPALGTVFSQTFRKKFLQTGVYQGMTPTHFLDALPSAYRRATEQYSIGFLAFGTWSVVQDMSFGDPLPRPRSWNDLASPEFNRQFSIQGFHGIASGLSLLALLNERHGLNTVTKFGGNLKNVRHFSEIIKGLNTRSGTSAPFNILPNAAVTQIPRHKQAVMLEFEEGQLMAPLMLFAKTSRLAESRKALDFFWSPACRAALEAGAFYMPDQMDWSRKYIFPSWDRLATQDFAQLAPQLNAALDKGRKAEAFIC